MHCFFEHLGFINSTYFNDIIMVENIVLCKCTKAPGTAIPEAFSMWRLEETHRG